MCLTCRLHFWVRPEREKPPPASLLTLSTIQPISEIRHLFFLNCLPPYVPLLGMQHNTLDFLLCLYKGKVDWACILFQHHLHSYSLSHTPESCPVKSVFNCCHSSVRRTRDYTFLKGISGLTLLTVLIAFLWLEGLFTLLINVDQVANFIIWSMAFLLHFNTRVYNCLTVKLLWSQRSCPQWLPFSATLEGFMTDEMNAGFSKAYSHMCLLSKPVFRQNPINVIKKKAQKFSLDLERSIKS